MTDYAGIYDTLYEAGYHASQIYSHARALCDDIEKLKWDSLLDVGCSHGWVLRRFPGREVIGLDCSAVAVTKARELRGKAVQGLAHDLPFPSKSFDAIICTDCLEHIHPDDIASTVKEFYRVARKFLALRPCPQLDTAHWKNIAGHPLHLTVQPTEWWIEQFTAPGGRVSLRQHWDFIITL